MILRPDPKLTLRADVHALWLAEQQDLWYAGGGAFQKRPSFGYAGRPGGASGLATVADLSIDYQWQKDTTVSVYFGYAAGGDVVRGLYAGDTGLFGYAELTQRL